MFSLIVPVVVITLLLWLYRFWFRLQPLPLPPGPKPLPFVGNLFQIPDEGRIKLFTKWGQTYGDVVYFTVCSRQFVVLNSASAAVDLLDKRGPIYSDRPYSTMASVLVGRWKSLLQLRYGERFRQSRKHMRTALNARSVAESVPFQEAASAVYLEALLRSPENFVSHIRRNVGGVSLKLTYGYDLVEGDDPFLRLAETFSKVTGEALASGRWLVDIFPLLRYVPAWVPGAHFQRWAKWARGLCQEFTDAPYILVKQNMAQGKAVPSFTSRALEALVEDTRKPPTPDEEDIIKNVAASIYAAGTDTTVALVSSFFLLMIHYPEVQRKAQEEIDRVIGHSRLPAVSDQDDLPYVGALIKELHRFHPVAPFVPHSNLQEDEYRGYRIPKGSWVGANTWAILRDPRTYPDPERFDPERFMPTKESGPQSDPREFSFGLGRRRCPGVLLASTTVFMSVARTLAVFDILKPIDEAGCEYTPSLEFTSANIVNPKTFKCRIQPRSLESTSLTLNLK